jgi:hypothetical protein
MIHAYWRERYPVTIFVPFAILIAAAGIAAGGSLPDVRDALISCVLAYTLIFVFRVADDLADLSYDRLRHPSRVLVHAAFHKEAQSRSSLCNLCALCVSVVCFCSAFIYHRDTEGTEVAQRNPRTTTFCAKLVQASNVTPIVVLAFVIAAGDVMIMLWQPRRAERLTFLAAISLFLGLWYFLRARLRAGPLGSAHVILVKYPVISLLACANWDHLTLPTALPFFGPLYLGMCIYEQLHDRAARKSRGSSWIFAAEVGLLVFIPLLMFSTGGFLR